MGAPVPSLGRSLRLERGRAPGVHCGLATGPRLRGGLGEAGGSVTVTVCDPRTEVPQKTSVQAAAAGAAGRRPVSPLLPWSGLGSAEPLPRGPSRQVPQGAAGPVPLAPTPRSELRVTGAPTLEVWQVTISAATHVLTSSALRRSLSRYLSWT